MRKFGLAILLLMTGCGGGEMESQCVPVLPGWLTPASEPPHYTVVTKVGLEGGAIT